MKKMFFVLLAGALLGNSAIAGMEYHQTEDIEIIEQVTVVENVYHTPRVHSAVVRPCANRVAEPVRVKTHTEVIDHYQVYQPVTVYKPMGTQIQRRVIPATNCHKCHF